VPPPEPPLSTPPPTLDGLAELLADVACEPPTTRRRSLTSDDDGDRRVSQLPALVRLRYVGDAFDLAVLSDVTDPVTALRGTLLPDGWDAIGVLARGTARRVDARTQEAAAEQRPIGFAVLVARSGQISSAIRDRDDRSLITTAAMHLPAAGADPAAAESPSTADRTLVPADGRLLDACCRHLGLPTPPPDTAPSLALATLWIDRIIETVLANPERPHRWFRLVGLHPLVGLFRLTPSELVADGRLERTVRQSSTDLNWPALLDACAAGRLDAPGVPAEHARWFDDGSFCRALMESLPSPVDGLHLLEAMLPADTVARVAATLLCSTRAAAAPAARACHRPIT
jgi:hypothetical protein